MSKVTEVVAKAKNVGISQKKGQIIAQIIRGMNAEDALSYLLYINKHAAKHFYKVVRSALFNAINNYNLNKNHLYIKNVRIDKARSFTRVIFRGKGGISYFKRPFSHITVELSLSNENTSGVASNKSNINKNQRNFDVLEESKSISSQNNDTNNSVEIEAPDNNQLEQSAEATNKTATKSSKESKLSSNSE